VRAFRKTNANQHVGGRWVPDWSREKSDIITRCWEKYVTRTTMLRGGTPLYGRLFDRPRSGRNRLSVDLRVMSFKSVSESRKLVTRINPRVYFLILWPVYLISTHTHTVCISTQRNSLTFGSFVSHPLPSADSCRWTRLVSRHPSIVVRANTAVRGSPISDKKPRG